MREDIIDRIIDEANYIIKTGATVRQTAKVFLFSKSTVHKDVTERLLLINSELHQKVKKVLDKNLSERHIRGGEATRKKYLLKNN
ncbi:MAG: stage III sporulation protein D [Clostridiales bacterium]|nr:stage III sporulation protein D [Clostridiales bacterium]